MKLTCFTDLGLRVLMYLTYQERKTLATITEISEQFQISKNHLVKVVHFMACRKWLVTTRGKGGGLALAKAPEDFLLGEVIRALEKDTEIIDCNAPPCALRNYCQLKSILCEAENIFFDSLNRYTLRDATRSPTKETIVQLVKRWPE